MWWEILAVALCLVAIVAMVIMLFVALAEFLDPTTVVRCRDCSRWMVDQHTRPEPVCFRCRHGHAHLAASWSHRSV